jgi:carbamate kinase
VLAQDIGADLLVIATDADAVYLDWGTPQQRAIATATPEAIEAFAFPAGSMGPKVEAAAAFARSAPGRAAVIGALSDITRILAGTRGTRIELGAGETTFR